MHLRKFRLLPMILLACGAADAAKERISILDFTVSPTVRKTVNADASQDLTQQVRDVATNLIDPAKFEVMTRENILVMLPPGKKDLSECEGQCEVETARNLGSRWHVVGDIKKPGSRLVMSIRLYDVAKGTQMGGARAEGATVDELVASATPKARELLARIPGLEMAAADIASRSLAEGASATKSGMVVVPAGCFAMGSNSGEENEKPVHRVCLRSFLLDAKPVTNDEYARQGGRLHYNDSSCYRISHGVFEKGPVSKRFQGDDQPVMCVDWEEASAYCRGLGKRLPTESEYEFANRAGSSTKWPCGDDEGCLQETSWYSANSGYQTRPVGLKKPNPWGLYDLSGNVWELTGSRFGAYPASAQTNPQGPTKGEEWAVRGGCWFDDAPGLRSTYRRAGIAPNLRTIITGFRCAADSH